MATRKEKYPDTKTFTYYNANPKNKLTTDCVVRAICTATEKKYEDVLLDLVNLQIKTGYDFCEQKCYGRYLESLGYIKNKQPRKDDNTKYTGKEFCKKKLCKNCVAHIGGNHIVAIKNYKVLDTWDSTDGCIGNYWAKE